MSRANLGEWRVGKCWSSPQAWRLQLTFITCVGSRWLRSASCGVQKADRGGGSEVRRRLFRRGGICTTLPDVEEHLRQPSGYLEK